MSNYVPYEKVYLSCLGKIVFYINLGAASTVGQFYLSKMFVDNELFSTVVAAVWASTVVAVYAYLEANQREEYARIKQELYNIKLVRGETPTATFTAPPRAPADKKAKEKITKIEIQHTMDPAIPTEKLPTFLRKEVKEVNDTPSKS